MRSLSRRHLDPVEPLTGVARPIPRVIAEGEAGRRLHRLRSLSWFLDRSIPIGKWRIGVDPILGLVPGAGDWIGAALSVYVLYEGARLGLPVSVLLRMTGNILVEAIVGTVPVLGDIFDFAWQANTRNLALVEQHYRPGLELRPGRRIVLALVVVAVTVLLIFAAGLYFVASAIYKLLAG